MKRNVLFLIYWSLYDGLTQGAALPHIKRLVAIEDLERVLLVTLERGEASLTIPNSALQLPEKVRHMPIFLKPHGLNLITKINDFIRLPKQLHEICKQEQIHCVVAHGAPAGALAYKVWGKCKMPFYVSLFEPHADYMAESGVWSKSGLKYGFQLHWEKQQKKHAAGLMPVTINYKALLNNEGVPIEKVFMVPCTVEPDAFKFNGNSRVNMRLQLKWEEATIGIYVGKYGGLYYEAEAFHIYKHCFETIPGFRLIILSPHPQEEILQHLGQSRIDMAKVYITSVPHAEVSAFLSAADFAFATYKLGPSKRFLSPIKIGEYWANGLPVLLTEGVGDDSDIIQGEGGGATFNLREEGSVERALEKIQHILKDPAHRQEIPKLAQKYRSPERIREAYEYFFEQNREEQP